MQAYEYRHQPLVLDDVDGLYADHGGIRLNCSVGLRWHSHALHALHWRVLREPAAGPAKEPSFGYKRVTLPKPS